MYDYAWMLAFGCLQDPEPQTYKTTVNPYLCEIQDYYRIYLHRNLYQPNYIQCYLRISGWNKEPWDSRSTDSGRQIVMGLNSEKNKYDPVVEQFYVPDTKLGVLRAFFLLILIIDK